MKRMATSTIRNASSTIQYASSDKEGVSVAASQSITLFDHTFSLANNGVLVIFVGGEYKLDKYTCGFKLYIDDNSEEIFGSNQTTTCICTALRAKNITAGTHRVRVLLTPQSGATVSVPQYKHVKTTAIILGAPPIQTA